MGASKFAYSSLLWSRHRGSVGLWRESLCKKVLLVSRSHPVLSRCKNIKETHIRAGGLGCQRRLRVRQSPSHDGLEVRTSKSRRTSRALLHVIPHTFFVPECFTPWIDTNYTCVAKNYRQIIVLAQGQLHLSLPRRRACRGQLYL